MAAYGEYVKRSIAAGKSYDDLPARIQAVLSVSDWRHRVKDHCILKGLSWADSLAQQVCSELEYYQDLVKACKSWLRLFPYHLSDFICRVMRVTPFKYYSDVMYHCLKEEKSYDRIPNFTAADALRVMGVGRNEYISILNQCKAKMMWRVNRGPIAKELLPQEPLVVPIQPWWLVSVVNIGEAEYRELSVDELGHLKVANVPDHIRVKDLDTEMVRKLYTRGLVYLDIPVSCDDRFSILPLEGFVSNKTSEQGDSTVDPIESLLYAVFVASSERLKVSDLATILNAEMHELQWAISIAVRLGFATRITDDIKPTLSMSILASETSTAVKSEVSPAPSGPMIGDLLGLGDDDASPSRPTSTSQALPLPGSASAQPHGKLPVPGGEAGSGEGHAIAVVLDAEATSYLMMGALSPGLKRHSVTLFEGGRVSGEEVMKELISELWVSYEAGQGFEGDMLKLTHYTAALATTLESIQSASSGRPIELLRKESLAGLPPAAACKVLYHAYWAVVPITPLPFPPLPLTPDQPGPAYFGPTVEATGPWLQLALYSASRCGPQSVVFVCGQRVWRLPTQLESCTHALLWPWDVDPDPASRSKAAAEGYTGAGAISDAVSLVETSFLLHHLNEMLGRTAVMVQPLGPPVGSPELVGGDDTSANATYSFAHQLSIVDVPLPLESMPCLSPTSPGAPSPSRSIVRGIERRSNTEYELPMSSGLRQALQMLGLSRGVGYVRMLRMPRLGQCSSEEMVKKAAPPDPSAQRGSSHHLALNARAMSSQSSLGHAPSGLFIDLKGASITSPSSASPFQASGSGTNIASAANESEETWVPLCVAQGMPLYCLDLCKVVCRRAVEEAFLSPEGRAFQITAQSVTQNRLKAIIRQYSSPQDGVQDGGSGAATYSPVVLPTLNMIFDGTHLLPVDLTECLQGANIGCHM